MHCNGFTCVSLLPTSRRASHAMNRCTTPSMDNQRLTELQTQSNQALMEGYEVPERLQDERQSLEKAIPALQKALRAAKVGARPRKYPPPDRAIDVTGCM